MGHAEPAFGPPARRSGLRVGDRPVHAGPFGACRGSEDAPAACRGTVILFGGEPSGTGSRGCPAVLDFRREGAGRTSTSAFPARTASLPRAGTSTDPGPRGFREETARRSPPAETGRASFRDRVSQYV